MYFLLSYLFCTANVLSLLLTSKVLSKNGYLPFWVNPCGYSSKNYEEYDENDDDQSIIDRILTLAEINQNNINQFKFNYIKNTFNCDYYTHYKLWIYEYNSWVVPRLLCNPEQDLTQSWLTSRSFPSELNFTYKVLQQVAVGFELLLEDANKYGSSESTFLNNFLVCKNDLQQLLCEINDSIDIKLLNKPTDVTKDVIPDMVRQESSTSSRNLTNSIIFRDYMIAMKYILSTYNSLNQRNKLLYNFIDSN